MAEETVATADADTESAQAATEVAPQEPAKGAEPEGPVDRREARRQMHLERAQREAKARAQAGIEEQQRRDAEPSEPETGKAGEAEPEKKPEGEPAAEAKPAEGAAEPGAKETEAKPAAAELVIEIDPRHPAAQGVKELRVGSEGEARVVRTLMKGYARHQDVELARERIADLEQQVMLERQGRIALEADRQVRGQWRMTNEYAVCVQRYNEIKDAAGEEAANEYWAGVEARLQEQTNAAYTEAVNAAAAQEYERRGEMWVNQMWERAKLLPEYLITLPGYQQWFVNAARAFNEELEAGTLPHVTQDNVDDQFIAYFHSRLIREPSVQAAFQQDRNAKAQKEASAKAEAEAAERKREAERQQAVEDWKKAQAHRRQENPPHPLGSLAGAPRDRSIQGSEPTDEEESAGKSVHQLRKEARRGAREDARRRFGA
jgi:hypothetical protein